MRAFLFSIFILSLTAVMASASAQSLSGQSLLRSGVYDAYRTGDNSKIAFKFVVRSGAGNKFTVSESGHAWEGDGEIYSYSGQFIYRGASDRGLVQFDISNDGSWAGKMISMAGHSLTFVARLEGSSAPQKLASTVPATVGTGATSYAPGAIPPEDASEELTPAEAQLLTQLKAQTIANRLNAANDAHYYMQAMQAALASNNMAEYNRLEAEYKAKQQTVYNQPPPKPDSRLRRLQLKDNIRQAHSWTGLAGQINLLGSRASLAEYDHNYAKAISLYQAIAAQAPAINAEYATVHPPDNNNVMNNTFNLYETRIRMAAIWLSTAQERVGYLYETGSGVPQSYPAAAHLYQQAVSGPHPDTAATMRLAFLYAHGFGVPRSRQRAIEMFNGYGAMGCILSPLVEDGTLPKNPEGLTPALLEKGTKECNAKAQRVAEAQLQMWIDIFTSAASQTQNSQASSSSGSSWDSASCIASLWSGSYFWAGQSC